MNPNPNPSHSEGLLTLLFRLEAVLSPRRHYKRERIDRTINPEYMFRMLRDVERLPIRMTWLEELLEVELRDYSKIRVETLPYSPEVGLRQLRERECRRQLRWN